MGSERFPADDPREWLNRARSNLIRSNNLLPEVFLEDLCFDAQQAAEKAFKALLLQRSVDFPRIHDLAELVNILERSGEEIPPGVREAGKLSRFAVFTRYPGLARPVEKEEHEEAVRIAEAVVSWVARRLSVLRAQAGSESD